MPSNNATQLDDELNIYNLEEPERARMNKQILDEALLAQERERQRIGMASGDIATPRPEPQPASPAARVIMAATGPDQIDIAKLGGLREEFAKLLGKRSYSKKVREEWTKRHGNMVSILF